MPSPTGAGAVSVVPDSDAYYIDSLLWGAKWGSAAGTGVTLTYSFAGFDGFGSTDPFSGYGSPSGDGEPWSAEFSAFSSTEANAARSALQEWARVADLAFGEVNETSSNVGEIRFAWTYSDFMAGESAHAYLPGSYAAAGDVWLNARAPELSSFDAGSYGYLALIHETGHALGLKHPFDGSPRLPGIEDNRQFTVMSYTPHPHSLYLDVVQTGPGSFDFNYYDIEPETPMLYDIAAMQYLYGANLSANTGNDTYTFDPDRPFFRTIWDAGGNDTISVFNFAEGSTIDLRDGHFSSIGVLSDPLPPGFFGTEPTYDGTDNLAIAYGASIENAVGGRGSDSLIGNAVKNALTGGQGSDTLDGGAGNDTLDGGRGSDSMAGGSGNDTYLVDAAGDSVTESAAAGTDAVESVTTYTLGPEVENLTLAGADAIDGTGNNMANRITGNHAANKLNGSGRGDTLNGGTDNDTLNGGNGNDMLNGGAGNDKLIGGSGNDTLIYQASDTSVQGGAGADILKVNSTGVVLNLTAVSNTVYTDIEVIRITGTGNNTLTVALSDVLAISTTTDTLRIDGNAGDTVNAGNGWTHGADQVIGANTYDTYTRSTATLLVDADITLNFS